MRRLFVRELSNTVSCSNPPVKSVHMLEELDWLNRQYSSKVAPLFEQQGPILEHELASLVHLWNIKQPKYQLRVDKLERLYQRIIDMLATDEVRNGLSAEVCSYLKKNGHFRRSVLLNAMVLTLWITKRRTSMCLLQNTLALTEEDLENCWKSIASIVLSQSMELPPSLKAFMFLHEQELMVVGRRLRDYLLLVGSLDETVEDTPRNYLTRMEEHVLLRCHQLNQHFRGDLLNFLVVNLQLLQTESNNGVDSVLFQATIDQFLLCCVYSGTLLRTGRSANFNDMLSSYAELSVKEDAVGRVCADLTIIDYYNTHYLRFLRAQGDVKGLLERTPGEGFVVREEFVEVLDYLK